MKRKSVLQSLLDELRGLIKRNEEDFAKTVLGDLDDAINRSDNPQATAYQWLKKYQSISAH